MNDKPVLPWWAGGLLLGGVLILAVSTVKPLGVSTQYVRAVGGVAQAVVPAAAENNAYLQEKKIKFGYGEALVLSIPLGAFLAAWASRRLRSRDTVERDVPPQWAVRFGSSRALRFAGAALGGFLLLFGARLAGGCTSGHILSGVSQLAVSSTLFFLAAFGSAVLTAKLAYTEN